MSCNWRRADNAELAHVAPTCHGDACTVGLIFPHSVIGRCRFAEYHLGDNISAELLCAPDANHHHKNESHDGTAAFRLFVLAAMNMAETAAQCEISIAGDSLSHDMWSAAVTGMLIQLRLPLLACQFTAGSEHWFREEHAAGGTSGLCGANDADRAGSGVGVDGVSKHYHSFATFDVTSLSYSQHQIHPSRPRARCSNLTISYWEVGRPLSRWEVAYRLKTPNVKQILRRSSVVLASLGTHANDLRELGSLFDATIRPLVQEAFRIQASKALDACNAPDSGHGSNATFGRAHTVVLLDTPPQHFSTHTGSGTFKDGLRKDGGKQHRTPCTSVTNVTAAYWRNAAMDAWVEAEAVAQQQQWRNATMSCETRLSPPPAWSLAHRFDIFLPRADLHGIGGEVSDCTHYCFTPFLYDVVWRRIAQRLDLHAATTTT